MSRHLFSRKLHRLLQRQPSPSRIGCVHDQQTRKMFWSRGDEDLFRYTSGRWLWDEDRQLKLRYRKFNVAKLKQFAIDAAGARTCKSIEKIAEGGSNRVFRLTLDSGSVIVRVPLVNEAHISISMASEVATMEFARTLLGLPVPKVLAWNSDEGNPAGISYMIMEEAKGKQLSLIWDDLELADKVAIVTQVANVADTMTSVRFNTTGNLFFRSTPTAPSCDIQVKDGVPQHGSDHTISRFVMGPSVASGFWEGGRDCLELDRGPWSSSIDYVRAIGLRELACAETGKPSLVRARTVMQNQREGVNGDTGDIISLYRKFLEVADALCPKEPELDASVLWHWDLRAPNIFVEDNRISAIIDWQDVWIGPLHLQAEHPPLIDYDGPQILDMPEEYKSLTDEKERQRIRDQVCKSLLLYTYEYEMQKRGSVVDSVLHLAHGKTIRETIYFATHLRNEGLGPLRQCLMRIEQNWSEIGGDRPCPFAFSAAELEQHYASAKEWNAEADFWDGLDGLVMKDGWTSNEDYEDALAFFEGLGEEGRIFLDYKCHPAP
ncbi:phosphotransferase enzyme family protein [Elsinoe ampelina]|uniref:Altered inheritance of mitochondria protein 9, mitochondrial n=1 Tax=Elsinoe ampelina TaxID=302913 RepID=A0A6A6G4A9_9PEZI|nr:phosphotransferase enzyme family protein [Elsinoe ampelina]